MYYIFTSIDLTTGMNCLNCCHKYFAGSGSDPGRVPCLRGPPLQDGDAVRRVLPAVVVAQVGAAEVRGVQPGGVRRQVRQGATARGRVRRHAAGRVQVGTSSSHTEKDIVVSRAVFS